MTAPKLVVPLVVFVATITTLQGQRGNDRTNNQQSRLSTQVIERTTTVISYAKHVGVANVEMQSTPGLPRAIGAVGIERRGDHVEIRAEFSGLPAATRFGPEYLTYVIWAITRDGAAINLGEVVLNEKKSMSTGKTNIAEFGIIVTAEPYFAVSRPSEVVVMESTFGEDLIGLEHSVTKYQSLRSGIYTANVPPSQRKPMRMDSTTPLELYEARHALWIAQWAGADERAADLFDKALRLLQRAEAFHASTGDTNQVVSAARESIQMAENARVAALNSKSGSQPVGLNSASS
jgi:hypothetical protein